MSQVPAPSAAAWLIDLSAARGPRSPRIPSASRSLRRRIVLTRQIAGVARDPDHANTVFLNPAGAPLAEAWALLGAGSGRLAVIGGTDVFGLFLERGYDLFHLSRAGRARLPGGRPVFPGVAGRSPAELLASHGLKPDAMQVLDPSADLTLTTWRR